MALEGHHPLQDLLQGRGEDPDGVVPHAPHEDELLPVEEEAVAVEGEGAVPVALR